MEKLIVPKNDMQELWELSGRVKAVLEWIKEASYIDNDVLAAMLGGQAEMAGSFVQVQEVQAKEETGAMHIEAEPAPIEEQERGGSNGESC